MCAQLFLLLGSILTLLNYCVLQVQSIVETLLEALPTPSYSVQEAVSDCLAPLMSALATDKTYVHSLAQRLLTATLSGPDYPHRYPSAVAYLQPLLPSQTCSQTLTYADLLIDFDVCNAHGTGCYLCFFTDPLDICCALFTMSPCKCCVDLSVSDVISSLSGCTWCRTLILTNFLQCFPISNLCYACIVNYNSQQRHCL